MNQKVKVNHKQCKLIERQIRPLKFRENHFDRPYLSFTADGETKLRVYLFSAAICHQTHTLINKKKNLKGWSVLEDVFTSLGKNNSEILDPLFLSKLSPVQLSKKIKPFFADDGNPAHCTLDRLDERSHFLIQISEVLLDKYNGRISNLIKKSHNKLDGKNGLYNLLKNFEAFSDPLLKKSTVFIQSAMWSKLLSIQDPESIEPVIDYHMQRLLLRTGCVEILDEKLARALREKRKIKSDNSIRKACVEAVRIIGKLAKKDFFEMDEILWSLGRSCCREKMLCTDKVCSKKPCTFYSFIDLSNHKKCIFDGACFGSRDENYRRFWEPQVDTAYY